MTTESPKDESAIQPVQAAEVGALALITLQPEQYAAEVYQPFKKRLAAAIESARSIEYDIATGKGLEVVTKARRTLMDIRIEANKQREARKAPIIQIGKLLESSYKAVEELVLPLETFFDGEIKAEEQRKENEKQAKIAAERVRIEAIQARIKVFGDLVLQAAGKVSADISAIEQQLEEIEITEEVFEEFMAQAISSKAEAGESLTIAFKAAYDAEQAAEVARIQREEEDRQRAEDAAKLEAQRAEQAKIAAAQAAESKRLADAAAAHQAEIDRQQREADARIKAAADAEEERQKAAKAKHDAEIKRQTDELEAQRAAFQAEQAAAQKIKDDAARLDADHSEAILMDAKRDEEIKREQESEAAAEIAASNVSCSAVADAMIAEAFDVPEAEPSDEEIIAAYVFAFGGDNEAAIERLRRFKS